MNENLRTGWLTFYLLGSAQLQLTSLSAPSSPPTLNTQRCCCDSSRSRTYPPNSWRCPASPTPRHKCRPSAPLSLSGQSGLNTSSAVPWKSSTHSPRSRASRSRAYQSSYERVGHLSTWKKYRAGSSQSSLQGKCWKISSFWDRSHN